MPVMKRLFYNGTEYTLARACPKIPVALFSLIIFTGCGWFMEITGLGGRESSFNVSIIPGEIYEGQQARVNVKFFGEADEAKSITWSLREAQSEALASNAEFVEVEGAHTLLGTSVYEFRITSRPDSGISGSKLYKLVVTSDGYSSDVELKVLEAASVSTVSITSTPNNGYVSLANHSNYIVNGLCSSPGHNVKLTAEVGGAEVSGVGLCESDSSWSIPLDFSGVAADGLVMLTATHAGDSGSIATTSITIKKDTTPPSIAITSPAAMTSISGAQVAGFSLSGTCSENGRAISFKFESDNGGGPVQAATVCTDGEWDLTANISSLFDGIVTALVTHLDEAGNSQTVSRDFSKDPTLPVITITQPAAGAIFNASTFDKVTISGACNIAGATVTVSGDVSGTLTTTCDGAVYTLSNIKLEGPDNNKTITVKIEDGAESDQKSVTVIKDTEAPVIMITSPAVGAYVNSQSQASFTVSGTCTEVGIENVQLVGDIVPIQVDCVAGNPDNTWTAQVDFSSASDGPVFIMASQTDAAGNFGSRTRAFIRDTDAPLIAFTSPAQGTYINNSNKGAFTVSGTCSEYSATPNITITSSSLSAPVTTTCGGTNWTATLAFQDGDESVEVTATIEDEAGNTRVATRTFEKDTTNPELVITSPVAGSYVNDSTKAAFTVSGTCSDPGINNVVITGAASKTVNCENDNTWSADLDFSAASDGVVSITVTHNDAAGNTHASTLDLNKDTTPPDVGWVFPLASTCATDVTGASFEVAGTCTSTDGDVTLSSTHLSSDVTVSCVNGEWSSILNLDLSALADLDDFTIQVSQTDVAGNIGQKSRDFKKLISTVPTVVHGGWDDIYAVGPKVYASNPGEPAEPTEPGVVRVKWKEWPSSNVCMPERVKVFRANAPGAAGVDASSADHPIGIRADVRTFTDTTLDGATAATADSATDFGKGWYYTLKVTIAGTDYDVTQPNEIAEVRVVAPPANMALVHRWIANQEVCGLMGRATDPENHYRCDYSGWGKSRNGDYYDLEHDLLVDRFELACNFTSQCGANADQPCLASEFGTVNPAAVTAADGQVFYNNASGDTKCFIKIAGTWREANWDNAAFTPALRAAMSTNLAHKPPLVRIDQNRSYETCQAHSVTLDQVPGFATESKRLLRAIEWRAAAAWSTEMDASGFANYDAFLTQLEQGGSGYWGMCNSSNAHGGVLTERTYTSTNAFYVGSKTATAQCQSRYGIQDMIGNVWEWVSDQLANCSALGLTCEGVTSALDPGNDFMNGFKFDDVTAPGSGLVTDWSIESKSFGAKYFSIPLGLPLLTDDGGNAISIDSWLSPTNKFHGDRIWLNPGNGNVSRGLIVGGNWQDTSTHGRWTSSWNNEPLGMYSSLGLRCAVPLPY